MGYSFLPEYIVRDNDGNKTGEIYTQENDFNIIFFKWVMIILLCLAIAPPVSLILFLGYCFGKLEFDNFGALIIAILMSGYFLIDVNNHFLIYFVMTWWLEPSTILVWKIINTAVLITSVLVIPIGIFLPSIMCRWMKLPITEESKQSKPVMTNCYIIIGVIILIGGLVTRTYF